MDNERMLMNPAKPKPLTFNSIRNRYPNNRNSKDIPPEQKVITQHLVKRIRKGLGANIIVTGSPGSGKSYTCLRIGELLLKELYNEEMTNPKKHLADNIASAFNFVRTVERPGMPLVLEEVSNIANSRRAMSKSNLSLNMLLDTVRKKQIVLLMNAPTIQSLDKHIQRMSHLYMETLRVNRKKGVSTLKVLRLQHSQASGKVYTHRLNIDGRAIWRCISYIPSKHTCMEYEDFKDKFLTRQYEFAALEAADREEKLKKQLEKHKIDKVMNPLTDNQKKYYTLAQMGYNNKQMAEKEDVTPAFVSKVMKMVKKKLGITGHIPVINPINLTESERRGYQ